MRRRRAILTHWELQGATVVLSHTARIAPNLQPYGKDAALVQLALDAWDVSNDLPTQTFSVPGASLIPITVNLGDLPDEPRFAVKWGVHRGHLGIKRAGRSPFVHISGRRTASSIETNLITIELDPTMVDQPTLIGLYPGAPILPLPWMNEAEHVPGGRDACAVFWREHAFVETPYISVLQREKRRRKEAKRRKEEVIPPAWW